LLVILLVREDEDFEIDDEEAIDAAFDLVEDIPDKLRRGAERWKDDCTQVVLQYYDGRGWKNTKSRIRFHKDSERDTDEICLQILQLAQKHAEMSDARCKYRAMWMWPAKVPGGYARKTCGFEAVPNSDGEFDFYDDGGMDEVASRKLDVEIFEVLFEKQSEQIDRLFDFTMQSAQEMVEGATQHMASAKDYAASIREIGDGMGSVTKGTVRALNAATQLVSAHQAENATVQLARIEQESDHEKWQMVGGILGKVAGPLTQQIASTVKKRQSAKDEKKKLPDGDAEEVMSDPAKELKEIFEALGDEKCSAVQQIVGDEVFGPLAESASEEDDKKAGAALAKFRTYLDKLISDNQFEALGKMGALEGVMGKELIERFSKLIPDAQEEK